MDGDQFGHYRLLELLGRGAMGEVWRARDTAKDRVVALKVLAQRWADDDAYAETFRRAVHTAAGLNEPHVVPIHDYGEIAGRLYVDMRLIDGRDLGALLADGPLEPSRCVHLVEQVAMALDAAHQIGLTHGGVTPSNVVVSKGDFANLTGFGIAHASGDAGRYRAPEQFTGGQADPRVDVYALACILFECLTGAKPFVGESLQHLAAAHLTTPPPSPSAVRLDLSSEIDAVITKAMAKDPGDRYQSVTAFAQAAKSAMSTPRTSAVAAPVEKSPPVLVARDPDDPPPAPDPWAAVEFSFRSSLEGERVSPWSRDSAASVSWPPVEPVIVAPPPLAVWQAPPAPSAPPPRAVPPWRSRAVIVPAAIAAAVVLVITAIVVVTAIVSDDGNAKSTPSTPPLELLEPSALDSILLSVDQSAVLFSSETKARDFFEKASEDMGLCQGKTVTMTYPNTSPAHWKAGPVVTVNPTVISQTVDPDPPDPTKWGCPHAMAVVANLVVESAVCRPHGNDEAQLIVEQMVLNAEG